MDCIFCKIAAGEIPSKIIYQDENIIAFNDIEPEAPIHVLIIPRTHVRDIIACSERPEVLPALHKAVTKIVENLGLAEDGFRLVINTGSQGGQTVFHLHIHLLAGRNMNWPPG